MTEEWSDWPIFSPPWRRAPGRVDVVLECLDAPERRYRERLSWLDPDEIGRAERFLRPGLGRDFVLSRGLLRSVLAGALEENDPARLEFAFGKHGKPYLVGDHASTPLRFNLSHSDRCAVVAVTLDAELGVDVERIRPDRDLVGLARRYFSPAESREILSLPESARILAFFRCWSRKEAYLKAKGGGLTFPLDRFAVTCREDEAPRLISTDLEEEGSPPWHLREILGGPDYVAALAVRGPAPEVHCWRWSE